MATYNGETYLREQLESIVSQLTDEDELVVSDDNSTDGTIDIIQSFADSRIRVVRNAGPRGHVKNFENALVNSRGRFIALSDQDDIWADHRLQNMVTLLEESPRASLLVGDFAEFNQHGELPQQQPLGMSPRNALRQLFVLMAGRAKYFGATFLIRRSLLRYVLPIPRMVEAHDIWIAMNACLHGEVIHCADSVLRRRIHDGNLTPRRRRGFLRILRSRLQYIAALGMAATR